MLFDYLRLKGALTVAGNADGNLAQRCFERFFRIAIACIVAAGSALIPFVAEMIFHFAFQHGFKDRSENLLHDILDILSIF